MSDLRGRTLQRIIYLTGVFLIAVSSFAQPPATPDVSPATREFLLTGTASQSTTPNHLLGPKDLIEVRVFQESDLTTSVRISETGKINFPLIGEVMVGGKTEPEAARLIREKLAARFLVDPQVSVTLVEATKRLFTVLGQVQRPGTYRFPDRETFNLIQVIGIAGGYTRVADPGRITVKRNDSGKDVVFKLNAKRMAADQTIKAFEIAPGDLITVGERLF